MRKLLPKLGFAVALLAANGLFARQLRADPYAQRCIWVHTGGTKNCAQGCEAWLFTECGDSDNCYDPSGTC